MKVVKIITLMAIGFGMAACAQQQQQEEPPIVVPEPVYDKYGNPI